MGSENKLWNYKRSRDVMTARQKEKVKANGLRDESKLNK